MNNLGIGNKVIVIGCSGSGKSYLSRKLRDFLNYPLCYIDMLYWKENWDHLPREELRIKLKDFMKQEKWIIDGNYSYSLEDRMIECDTVFFLDLPTEVCIESEEMRRGKKREDLPNFLEEKPDPEFIDFIKNFSKNGRKVILELIKKYPNKSYFIFTSRDDVNNFISKMI